MRNDPGKHADGNFLARWSRRKADGMEQRRSPAGVAGQPPAGGEISEGRRDGAELPARAPQTLLTDEQMPPIDSLTEDSDFSGFLSPGVSEELRKLALRKLFRSAIFNDRDGLDDYDEDFRHFPALGDHITSDMKHRMEVDEQRKRRAQEAETEAAAEAESPPEPERPTEDLAPDEAQADQVGEAGDVNKENPARADNRSP